MSKLIPILLFVVATIGHVAARDVPAELRGRWVITRELPATTISCWGTDQAKALIGTEIQYTVDSFRWKDKIVNHPKIEAAIVSAQQFHDENSGHGTNGSEVSFGQLGIRSPDPTQITLDHPPFEITRATTEIPGDAVLLKDKKIIVFSICNLYFEAKRLAAHSKKR